MQHNLPLGGVQPAGARRSWPWLERFALAWEQPVPAAAMALTVYLIITACFQSVTGQSSFAYFTYLADALLHGQLYLRVVPQARLDLSLYEGRYFLYWAPFPAVLMLPFVALFGVHFSDIAFTLGLGAINVALVAVLFRRACQAQVIQLSPVQRGLLVLFFALGTVHLTLAPFGRVWFTGQLVSFGCVLLAYLATLGMRGGWAFFWTGAALAGALLTRNHMVLAGIWPAYWLLSQHWRIGWRRRAGYAALGTAPLAVAVALLGLYNLLRFGSLGDNGLAYHQMAAPFASDYQRYGAFNLHYLLVNLFYQYLAYPFPINPLSFQGGSLFLLSPAFFAMFWAFWQRPRWSAWALLASILAVNVPILLLMGTGWFQFGPRYTLDFTVPLLLLTAMGVRRWPVWLLALLVAVSVATYLCGTIIMGGRITL